MFNERGQPEYRDYVPGEALPKGWSILPFFPGYSYHPEEIIKSVHGTEIKKTVWKSSYRGIDDVGEGGMVYAKPGIYYNVPVLDIASMHPHSAIAELIFGSVYTNRYADLIQARIYIKHRDFENAGKLFDGKLKPYLTDEKSADELANALKIAINSVYGMTSASFPNRFKDPRNTDNIVAKRGALFMVNLLHEVEDRGYTVVHIKTDSIKIANADDDIIRFVMSYGKEFGYTFEHECTYDRICLVNKSTYIAKYDDMGIRNKGGKHAGEWTATGTQFQVPYVFKSLFTHEPITFNDVMETKSVKEAMYLKMDSGDMQFIGKVDAFCPVLAPKGGELLSARTDDSGSIASYTAVTGTKGYRWMEAVDAKNYGMDIIDKSYYTRLCDEAVDTIRKYGDFEVFTA